MVTAANHSSDLRALAWNAAAQVVDPEIPVLTIADLGVLRDVTVTGVVNEATLALPKNDWMQQGGRVGRHSEHLGHLLSELQSLQRTFPGATW